MPYLDIDGETYIVDDEFIRCMDNLVQDGYVNDRATALQRGVALYHLMYSRQKMHGASFWMHYKNGSQQEIQLQLRSQRPVQLDQVRSSLQPDKNASNDSCYNNE